MSGIKSSGLSRATVQTMIGAGGGGAICDTSRQCAVVSQCYTGDSLLAAAMGAIVTADSPDSTYTLSGKQFSKYRQAVSGGPGIFVRPWTLSAADPSLKVVFACGARVSGINNVIVGFQATRSFDLVDANSACLYWDGITANWKIATRGSSGAATYTDSGVAVAVDTLTTVVFAFTGDGTSLSVSINGGANVVVTATLPSTSTGLGFQVVRGIASGGGYIALNRLLAYE